MERLGDRRLIIRAVHRMCVNNSVLVCGGRKRVGEGGLKHEGGEENRGKLTKDLAWHAKVWNLS